ncbi:MAG: cupin domain-containing protein [Pseudomonadota bacterium]
MLAVTAVAASANERSEKMDAAAFKISELKQRQVESERPYLPFINEPTLSTGLYVLPVGAEDTQQPHDQDEVYHVLSGRAKFIAGDEEYLVSEGSVLFVKARVEHRFTDITEDLTVLVFFSTAESE